MTASGMRLLFTCLKGSFIFKKIKEIIRTYSPLPNCRGEMKLRFLKKISISIY